MANGVNLPSTGLGLNGKSYCIDLVYQTLSTSIQENIITTCITHAYTIHNTTGNHNIMNDYKILHH